MFLSKSHKQTILVISHGDYINATANSFLIDRQARELSKHTLRFYREFLRRYFLAFGEKQIQAASTEPTELYVHSSHGL